MTIDQALALEGGEKLTYIPGGLDCTFVEWSQTSDNICVVKCEEDGESDVLHISDFTSDYELS